MQKVLYSTIVLREISKKSYKKQEN